MSEEEDFQLKNVGIVALVIAMTVLVLGLAGTFLSLG